MIEEASGGVQEDSVYDEDELSSHKSHVSAEVHHEDPPEDIVPPAVLRRLSVMEEGFKDIKEVLKDSAKNSDTNARFERERIDKEKEEWRERE